MSTKITLKSVRSPVSSKRSEVAKTANKTNDGTKTGKHDKFMFSVDQNLSFYLNDGRRLYNLRDLENALQGMNMALFSYHVNEQRNDFANWIQDVFGFVELANEMRNAKTNKAALQKLKAVTKKINTVS